MSINNENNRLILYYNGAISALTLFTEHPNGHICTPQSLPVLSSLLESVADDKQSFSEEYEKLVTNTSEAMALPQNLLTTVSGFKEQVETPQGVINVYLARFDVLDPPHDLMSDRNCKLKTLLELKNRSDIEMELLRKAYSFILES